MRSLKEAGIVGARRPHRRLQPRVSGQISLLRSARAVQGPFQVNRCVIGMDICPRSGSCPLRPTWLRIQRELELGLGSRTLAQIAANVCTDARPAG